MRSSPVRSFLLGPVLLAVTVGGCLILSARSLRGNHGLSVFGHAGPALLPFVVGLTSVAAVTARTARLVPTASRRARVVKAALYAFALCIVGIVVTPDDVATWVYDAHIAASAALFAGQFFLAAWLSLIDRRQWTDLLLFLALFAAGLVAMASQFNWISHLFAGEVAFQTIFLILLARVLADLAVAGGR
jgi:cation transport ATPase